MKIQKSNTETQRHRAIRLQTYVFLCLIALLGTANAQQSIRYTGNTLVNVDYPHGQLAPVLGVHSTQLLRANREHPEIAEGTGWTYNHAPMLSYWNKTFYLEYLSDSIGESVPPGQTLLLWSKDGQNWTRPQIIFPRYRIPDGTTKEGKTGVAKNLDAVMHQRMGFYVSKKNRLLVLGFYGICLDPKDDPNDGKYSPQFPPPQPPACQMEPLPGAHDQDLLPRTADIRPQR